MVLVASVGCERDADQSSRQAEVSTKSAEDNLSGGGDSFSGVRALIRNGQMEEARRKSKELMISNPTDSEAFIVAAEVQMASGDRGEAAKLLEHAAELSDESKDLMLAAASTFLSAGKFGDAERMFQRTSKAHPYSADAHRALCTLFNEQGKRWHANQEALRLAKIGEATARELIMLVAPSKPYAKGQFRKLDVHKTNGASSLDLAEARVLFYVDRNAEKALEILSNARTEYPGNTELIAFEGLIKSTRSDSDEFIQWQKDAPDSIREFAEYWVALSNHHRTSERYQASILAATEALRIDARQRDALSNMIESFRELGRGEDADACHERLRKVDALHQLVSKFAFEPSRDLASADCGWHEQPEPRCGSVCVASSSGKDVRCDEAAAVGTGSRKKEFAQA